MSRGSAGDRLKSASLLRLPDLPGPQDDARLRSPLGVGGYDASSSMTDDALLSSRPRVGDGERENDGERESAGVDAPLAGDGDEGRETP